MDETKKKEQASTHKIGIYLWIWGLLFVLSFFSYMVDWYQFQGMLRWSLILFFMFLKAGLIMAFFMHLFWERYWRVIRTFGIVNWNSTYWIRCCDGNGI